MCFNSLKLCMKLFDCWVSRSGIHSCTVCTFSTLSRLVGRFELLAATNVRLTCPCRWIWSPHTLGAPCYPVFPWFEVNGTIRFGVKTVGKIQPNSIKLRLSFHWNLDISDSEKQPQIIILPPPNFRLGTIYIIQTVDAFKKILKSHIFNLACTNLCNFFFLLLFLFTLLYSFI